MGFSEPYPTERNEKTHKEMEEAVYDNSGTSKRKFLQAQYWPRY